MQNLITLFDITTGDVEHIFSLTDELKEKYIAGDRRPRNPGQVLGLLFEKPSLRTRVSFEAAIAHLGGNCVYLGPEVGWGERETTADFGRVVSQYLDVLVCRARQHSVVEELTKYCRCPVVNGLTELAHPCQALADVYTVRQLSGEIARSKVAYVGDGNNVVRSLLVACAQLNISISVATPAGYELPSNFVAQVKETFPSLSIELTNVPKHAVRDATVVYTDVWASMGQEDEVQRRRRDFADFQVNADLMSHATPDARFMHCLPARRGQEVTDDVIDGPKSIVVEQAANRMHVQKGILAWLLEQSGPRPS